MTEIFAKPQVSDGRRKSAYVLEQILLAIRDGKLKVGDRLPSERAISQAIDVSRNSVREALSTLQIYGAAVSKPGDGTYLTNLDNLVGLESEMVSNLEEEDNLFDAIEERVILECGGARLAAKNASPEDRTKLRDHLQRMKAAVRPGREDLDGYFESNRLFHLCVASATGNGLIERHIEALLRVMAKQLWQKIRRIYLVDIRQAKDTIPVHVAIYEAIRERDGDAAERHMRDHFKGLDEPLLRHGQV